MFYAFPESHKVLLDTQDRMPHEITNLLSEVFYEDCNKSFEGKNLFSKPLVYIDMSKTANRYETSLLVGKEYQLETNLIVEFSGYVLQYIKTDHFLTLEDSRIISAYKNQGELIELKLTAKFPPVIIYSFPNCYQRIPERRRVVSLSELRRFNEALSRYEKQFIVIDNDSFIRLHGDWCKKGVTVKVDIATLRNHSTY